MTSRRRRTDDDADPLLHAAHRPPTLHHGNPKVHSYHTHHTRLHSSPTGALHRALPNPRHAIRHAPYIREGEERSDHGELAHKVEDDGEEVATSCGLGGG